jgi:pyruvate/2-oxoglutarate/acetoin dehydrogenase E1 component
MTKPVSVSYSRAIREAFRFLLTNDPDVFVLGQGLWSPWYVGRTMTDLDKEFGSQRVIDTPVSESLTTAAAVGASISGMKPIVVHPRMDFMLYAMDTIVNQASKWRYIFQGKSFCPLTIRSIINRGGEQGAQHSQSLQSLYAHIPGLRVVMPYSPEDAFDLLVASVNCKDPVVYIDDRWLYDLTSDFSINERPILNLAEVAPVFIQRGHFATVVSSSYGVEASRRALQALSIGKSCDLIDLRVVSPISEESMEIIRASVRKTRRLIVVDAAWAECGISAEIITRVYEGLGSNIPVSSVKRVTLPASPAPCASSLEQVYYSLEQNLSYYLEQL